MDRLQKIYAWLGRVDWPDLFLDLAALAGLGMIFHGLDLAGLRPWGWVLVGVIVTAASAIISYGRSRS